MKVAIVCPDGHSVLLFCKGIIKALVQVAEIEKVIVISSDEPYKKEIENLGVKSISLPINRYLSPFRDLKYIFLLFKIYKKENISVVINFSTKPNIYGTISAKFAGVKEIVCHVLGLGSVFLNSSDFRAILIKGILINLYRLAFKFCSKAWFTNQNDVNFFTQRGLISQKKIILTKNYLDIDYYSPDAIQVKLVQELKEELSIGEKDMVVLMVARLIWPKGIKEFIDAAELLYDKIPYLKFLLVAPPEPGNPNAVPPSFVREKEKNCNFKWLGFRADVKTLYAVCDLAVLPSYYKEGGYPRGLLEPMAMGKPLITTDCADCRGTIENGKNGILIPARDSVSLANAIEIIVRDSEKRYFFGRNSLLKAREEFDEAKIIPKALDDLNIFQSRVPLVG